MEEVGWLVLRSAAFTPGESPRYSFGRRLSGPQDQSGHEGAKKNLRHPGSNPGRPARSSAPCRLSYLAHIGIYIYIYIVQYISDHRCGLGVTSLILTQRARVQSPVGSISWLRFFRCFPLTISQMPGNLGRLSYGHHISTKFKPIVFFFFCK